MPGSSKISPELRALVWEAIPPQVRQAVLAEIPDIYSRDDFPELVMHVFPTEFLKVVVTELPEFWNLHIFPLVEPVELPRSEPLQSIVHVPGRLLHHFDASFQPDLTALAIRRLLESGDSRIDGLRDKFGDRAMATCLGTASLGLKALYNAGCFVNDHDQSWDFVVNVQTVNRSDVRSLAHQGDLEISSLLPSMPSPMATFRAVEIDGEVKFSASTQHPA